MRCEQQYLEPEGRRWRISLYRTRREATGFQSSVSQLLHRKMTKKVSKCCNLSGPHSWREPYKCRVLEGEHLPNFTVMWTVHQTSSMKSGETAAIVARELAEQTKTAVLRPGDIPSTVRAMAQLVELLDVQLRNLTPGGKDTAARSLNK
ncbi:adhesion G protein-coupled receptor L3 isoform X1, partial [Tachysurus ichikawai]